MFILQNNYMTVESAKQSAGHFYTDSSYGQISLFSARKLMQLIKNTTWASPSCLQNDDFTIESSAELL